MTKTITLELTQDQVIMCLEAVTTERVRFRNFADQRQAQGESISPQALANLDALDYLSSTLKAKAGQW